MDIRLVSWVLALIVWLSILMDNFKMALTVFVIQTVWVTFVVGLACEWNWLIGG